MHDVTNFGFGPEVTPLNITLRMRIVRLLLKNLALSSIDLWYSICCDLGLIMGTYMGSECRIVWAYYGRYIIYHTAVLLVVQLR